MASDPAVLSEAIVAWTGHGTHTHPVRDATRLVEVFGADLATPLIPEVESMADDFYKSDARLVADNPASMGDIALAEFTTRHPELAADAGLALAWCYTFDYK